LKELVPAASSAFRHGSQKKKVEDDSPAARATTSKKLQESALLAEIPRLNSSSGDRFCHQSFNARRA
jgi:hypothetical protein